MYFPERNRRMLKEFLKHRKTLNQIGEEYGITRERVRQIIYTFGYKRTTSVFLSENEIDWVAVKRLAKLLKITRTEIATKVGCNDETAKHILCGDPRYGHGITAERVLVYILGKVSELSLLLSKISITKQ